MTSSRVVDEGRGTSLTSEEGLVRNLRLTTLERVRVLIPVHGRSRSGDSRGVVVYVTEIFLLFLTHFRRLRGSSVKRKLFSFYKESWNKLSFLSFIQTLDLTLHLSCTVLFLMKLT